MYARKGPLGIEVVVEDPRVSGFANDDKHTTFFRRSGGSYRVRSISRADANVFALAPLLSAFSLGVMIFLLPSVQHQGIGAAASIVSSVVALMLMACWIARQESASSAPWPETLFLIGLIGVCYGISRHPFSVDVWFFVSVLLLMGAFVGFITWGVTRASWEPAASALLTAVFFIVASTVPLVGMFQTILIVMAIMGTVVGLLGALMVHGESGAFESSFDHIDGD